MAKKTVNIRLSVHDAGCLPVALGAAIRLVTRSIQAAGDTFSPDEKQWTQDYLQQLRTCLAAVVEARGK